MASDKIKVEVAYATPEKQRIVSVDVAPGTVAYDVVLQSGIDKIFPEIDVPNAKMGLFGKAIQPKSQAVEEGDRIEIYRPLKADPKASRAARAEKAKAARS
jgi:uncharacterized protein